MAGKGRPGPAPSKNNAANRAIRELLDARARDNAEDIVQAVIDAAKGGDMTACQILTNRIWPTRKGALIRFDFPEIRTPADLGLAVDAVTGLAAAGKLSIDEAVSLSKLVEIRAKAFELIAQQEEIDLIKQQIAELKALTAPKAA